ncbi:penicillin-binding protein 1A [Coxiella endosymbiont of Ornithodoros maritimus]|uniref:penicillin-binding protein 1A n=1 Tax=Coxiella endosymbiont of Ornithodoros maritimus TaxID=1656172 RepID=UPI0022645DD4|nr:penicillin-binding protein 1A [Coxiella endosymbiont of Ornithodoros maritimus]
MSKVRHFAVHTIWALFSFAFTIILAMAVIYVYMEWRLPDVKILRDVHLQVPLRIYTADGKLITQFGTKRRIPVTLDQVPKSLIYAVLATEDARFYEHPGVDLISIIRAAKAFLLTGKRSQGASTITMQVARNFFLIRKKTYTRKINEILLALKIDKELSKNKILELYLNKIYFGNHAYGVAAAAEVYYGRPLNQLTLPQMAMIAGLPQAPSRNNPLENPKAALLRRNHVLKRMLEVNFITKEKYLKAIKAPLTAKYHAATTQVKAPYVAEMAREVVVDRYGEEAYDHGLNIYTTISSKLQEEANRALRDGLIAYEERHQYRKPHQNLGVFKRDAWLAALKGKPMVDGITPAGVITVNRRSIVVLLRDGRAITVPWSGLSWARPALENGYVWVSPRQASDIVKVGDVVEVIQARNDQWWLTQIPEVEGGLVALDPQDGAVNALTGGFDYEHSNFNRITQAERQPGSNFKPFLYSAALAKGYTLASMINDAPVVMQDSGENALWRPMNDTRKFYGPTSIRVGLMKSRNLVSIRLLQKIGIPYAIEYLTRFGFDPNVLPHSLSLALGSAALPPLQVARGYAIFANGGYRITPYFISRIEDQSQDVLFRAKPPRACSACVTNPNATAEQLPNPMAPKVITSQNAYLITQAMHDVIQYGTGRRAKILNRPDLAGKTGTTNDQVDAWFSGFNSNLETTVWVGYDNLRSLHEYGAQAALPIWIQFMRAALQGQPKASLPQPPGTVMVRIDPHTGLLASPNQPESRFEIFRQRYAPTQFSTASSDNTGGPNDSDSEDQYLF